jgi:membrane protease YdiL (CAAX protease family)
MQQQIKLKPLFFWPSVLFFGLPALLFVAGFWAGMPWLISLGMLPYYAYLISLCIPLVILLLLSLLWLHLEGLPVSRESLVERFRLKPMNGKAWLWSLGALLVGGILGFAAVSSLSSMLVSSGIIPIPDTIPGFMDPTSMIDPMLAYNDAVGGLEGNWLALISLSILLVFNIVGEEFWWRGVVLPRQELAFGKWTWVVHGVMWAFFHIFKWWDVLNLLPITLALSFVCSRLKNTTPGIVIHGIFNGIALIPLLLGVLGILS